MTEQEKIWFEQLCSRNAGIWKTLCLPEVRGLLDSSIYKYNDTAHFIYELLQNADDAEATDVEFVLDKEKLILRHNGTIRFSVSNPENILEDKASGKLGHVNAITYFNFSGKEDDVRKEIKQNKIGKFGIGFKSVYRYTSTPFIYDDNISFKIENMMIPSILEDSSFLEPGKTVFIIPFNSGHITAEEAYKEIETKLKGLYQPQLFLQHIQRIRWSAGMESGDLQQQVEVEDNLHNCHIERLAVSDGRGKTSTVLKLYRNVNIPIKGTHRISIAYTLDKNGYIETSTKSGIHCFFPISEYIPACFDFHAPFMLADTREHLLPNDPTNKFLLRELAKMSADSLLVLRDFGKKERKFLLGDRLKDISRVDITNLRNWESFVENGSDIFREAYNGVFENEAVFLSSGNEYLKAADTIWAKESLRSLISSSQLQQLTGRKDYCLCSCGSYNSSVKGLGGVEEFTNGKLKAVLTTEFLSRQDDIWLDKFYRYIHDNHLAQAKTETLSEGIFREEPIFKTDAGHFVSAFSRGKQEIYLYTKGVTTPEVAVNQELFRQSEGLRQLTKSLEITEADSFDHIQLKLNDDPANWTKEDANYFCVFVIECKKKLNEEQQRNLRILLQEKWKLKCNRLFSQETCFYSYIQFLYWDSQLIRDYYEIAGVAHEAYLKVTTYGDVKARQLVDEVRGQYILDKTYYSTAVDTVGEDIFVDFLNWVGVNNFPRIVSDERKGRIIDNITRVLNILRLTSPEWQKKGSHIIWDILCYYIDRGCDLKKLSYKYPGIPQYDKVSLYQILLNVPWFYIEGALRPISDRVYRESLATEEYGGNGSEKLISLLGITTRPSLSDAGHNGTSEESKEKTLKDAIREYVGNDRIDEGALQKIAELFKNQTQTSEKETPSGEIEKESIEELTLEKRAKSTERYTYQWFKLLMEAEAIASGKDNENKKNKAVKIDFRNVIFQYGDIIKLENADRYIPQSLEEAEKIDVKFFYQGDTPKTISFDAASVKDNTLLLKVKNKQKAEIEELRKIHITYATVNVEHPIDLAYSWKRLIDSFSRAGFTDTYSFRNEIRSDLHFIFGPPGSGKTTQLADEIIAKIKQEGAKRILVLAPTNKACDVITKKIIERTQENCPWLHRFVKTLEDDLEEYVLFHETPIGTEQACVVSTIARYAYDNCSEGLLTDMEWDYVIIDEASMIPLYQIIAPIFNNNSRNILIAGDPFQIQPIVKCEEWKNRNIYTMLGIKDFENPQTRFVDAQNIIPLEKQFRSVPEIGKLFGRYSYKGRLQHERTSEDQIPLNFGFTTQALNLITFPCSQKSNSFLPQRLKGSNIHVYSVIFVVELLKYITRHIAEMDLDRTINIGVVGPYIAEIKAIEKMQEQLVGYHEKVNIVCGSAHGFQGDECDVVIAVLNPPAGGLKKFPKKTLINNQNVLNVSISRAKDYLFVIMPDSDFELKDKLDEPNKIEEIMCSIGCQQYSSHEIERIIFGRQNEIEENTFVTSHQLANVYTDFSKKYEIRIDDNAIDIQVN